MLDDLRKSTVNDTNEFEADAFGDVEEEKKPKRFLGMTAVERMFLLMFLFMNVLVIGAALLLVTGRLSF
jgi:hypothetical protein